MAIQWDVSTRNARLEALRTQLGTTSKLQIWTGAPPANTGVAATGTQLVEVTLTGGYAAAAAGAMALAGLPISTTAMAGGTMGYYRLVNAAETTTFEQGTVTATGGGGDLTVDNPTVVNGQAVNITGFTKTEPGA